MAAENGGNDHQEGNSVSQAAHMKDHGEDMNGQGENNREAAHAHAYGQQWKQWRMTDVDPEVTAPVENAPKTETPVTTTPKVDAPVTTPVTAPVSTPVNVSPKVDAPAGNVTTGDNLDGDSLLNAPLSGDKVGETDPDLGGLNLHGAPKFF